MSDTHNLHRLVRVPDGDVLVHCGDATMAGTYEELSDFGDWLRALPHGRKLFVPGNHDLMMDPLKTDREPDKVAAILGPHFEGVDVVTHGRRDVGGVPMFFSSWTPRYRSRRWAFHYERNTDAAAERWGDIDPDTVALFTHGPPMGVLDGTGPEYGDLSAGCADLLYNVLHLNRRGSLRLHAFGHIHSGYGRTTLRPQDGRPIEFVNAALCDNRYAMTGLPQVVDL